MNFPKTGLDTGETPENWTVQSKTGHLVTLAYVDLGSDVHNAIDAITEFLRITQGSRVIIVGDFNRHLNGWNCPDTD